MYTFASHISRTNTIKNIFVGSTYQRRGAIASEHAANPQDCEPQGCEYLRQVWFYIYGSNCSLIFARSNPAGVRGGMGAQHQGQWGSRRAYLVDEIRRGGDRVNPIRKVQVFHLVLWENSFGCRTSRLSVMPKRLCLAKRLLPVNLFWFSTSW